MTIKIGDWNYDPSTKYITFAHGPTSLDLASLKSSAAVLDFIMQVESKPFFTAEQVGDLVRLIHRLLQPQSTLCSFGMSGAEGKRINDPDALAAERITTNSPRYFVSRAEDPEHLDYLKWNKGH